MKAVGITLNDKCVFSIKTIKFLGHIISKEGFQIDPEKLKVIMDLSKPQYIFDTYWA